MCVLFVAHTANLLGQFTSSEPSPKIEVRIGVENMVMMVNKTATPAVMENIN